MITRYDLKWDRAIFKRKRAEFFALFVIKTYETVPEATKRFIITYFRYLSLKKPSF